MVKTSTNVTSDIDEFDLAGLTKKTAEKIQLHLLLAHRRIWNVNITIISRSPITVAASIQ